LEQKIQVLSLHECVKFIGHRTNIAGQLADATSIVHTLDNEGCPNVVMEAMTCGRAVIATDVCDAPSLVEDGKTGFTVRRGNNAMFADRVMALLCDHTLCRRMGEAGRAKAEREFGLDRVVPEPLAVYQTAG
jgi:glycosyltransferase involved in cell wall biosynthesis